MSGYADLSPRAQDLYDDQIDMGASEEEALEAAQDLDAILGEGS